MGLLKYLGKLEVIKIFGEKEPEKIIMDGPFERRENLYPERTERVVKKYFLFPRKIGKIKVRGNQLVKQVCKHNTIPEEGDHGNLRFEHWYDTEILV